ncbi:hypothetical protein [Rhodococcus sp. SJ-2]
MTLTPTPHSEPPQQIDAGMARYIADIAAGLVDTLVGHAGRDHHHREYNMRCAEIGSRIAINMRTYAALVEADDFLEPRGGTR